MSSIFRKLSIILCCLFSLFFVNPVTLATPGDYLVYFLGKDYKDKGYKTLECGKCERYLDIRAGQFCCCNHCFECGYNNIPKTLDSINVPVIHSCKCGVSNAYSLLRERGPFCFIKYENGGNMNTVFENAKKSRQLYCAYCMAKELKDNFNGTIFSNVPAEIVYRKIGGWTFPISIPGQTLTVAVEGPAGLSWQTFTVKLEEVFKLNALGDNAGSASNICNYCNSLLGNG